MVNLATPTCHRFEWQIEGAAKRRAPVEVHDRKRGSGTWQRGIDRLRPNREREHSNVGFGGGRTFRSDPHGSPRSVKIQPAFTHFHDYTHAALTRQGAHASTAKEVTKATPRG